jgi:hypothetical protein
MKSLSVVVVAILTSLVSAPAEGYIPHSSTIANRTAKNSGKGLYVVEQEVRFRTASDPVVLRERWVVENGETMRLSVSSPKAGSEGARFEAFYREGKRTAPDFQGSVRTSSLSPEFLEGFFHSRSGRGLLGAMVRAKVAPAAILREKPRASNLNQISHQREPYVRLGRTGGVVAWVFGEATPADSAKPYPGAWIEQDMFVVRKVRFPSEAEVVAERHNVYGGSMRFPRVRTLSWGNHSAEIHVLSVKPISAQQAQLSGTPDAKAANLPDLEQVREFYSRFR